MPSGALVTDERVVISDFQTYFCFHNLRSPEYPLFCLLIAEGLLNKRAPRVTQVVKNPPTNAGEASSVPGWGRSPGEGNGNPLQYSCLENPLDTELGRLQSIGSQRVGRDLSTEYKHSATNWESALAAVATAHVLSKQQRGIQWGQKSSHSS